MKLILKFYLIFMFLGVSVNAQSFDENWPNWRGPDCDGVSLKGNPPTEWSETKNIKWKTPIPGRGLGTPIVWGDQIFMTTAIELDEKATEDAIKRMKKESPGFGKLLGLSETTEHILQFVVYAINKNTGEIIWQKVVREQFPHEGIQENGSWASQSCVTDGEHVIASFGSFGIYCFDMKGNMIWEKDLGDMEIEMAFGEGISPVLYKEKLIILWDHEGQSKIFVLNKNNGEEIWMHERDEPTGWATPLIVEVNEKPQIVVPARNNSRGYDLETGDTLWKYGGLGDGIIPCPVYDGENVFLMTGFQASIKVLQAINLSKAKGELKDTDAISWELKASPSYVPSPLLKDGKIYYLKASKAQITCVDAKTGKIFYEAQRPEGVKGAYASPIWANGLVYFIDRKGACSIIKDGEQFEVVAVNVLEDNFDASPVVIGKDLFLRGWNNLYCISEE